MDMNAPIEIPATFEPSLPLDASALTEPLDLEGSVQRFDPIARAANIATSMPREWCGSYMSFSSGNSVDVKLTFASVQPIGQMVDLRGNMQIGDLIKPKMHLEALREPHREDHGLLEVHTRWEDPKKDFQILNSFL